MGLTDYTIPAQFADRIRPVDGCWIWTGSKQSAGYGNLRRAGESLLAHRVVYELLVGSIPSKHDLHHRCDSPACVNPAHLEPLTRSEHRWRHARDTCKRGHPFDDENTRWDHGKRQCRACDRLRAGGYEIRHYKKLTGQEAEEIRRATGSLQEIADRFGVTKSSIWRVKRGLSHAQ